MADPHKVSTIYSSFLPNLLPTPSYPSSARLSWSVSYTALLQIELVSGSVAHSTNFPSRQLTVLITRLGSVNQHRPPRTSGFGGYTVGNTSTPPSSTRVNTLQWNTQGHRVARGFVIVHSRLGQCQYQITQ
jgi:hypothetical protein